MDLKIRTRIYKGPGDVLWIKIDKDVFFRIEYIGGEDIEVTFPHRSVPPEAELIDVVLSDLDKAVGLLIGGIAGLNYWERMKDFPNEFIPFDEIHKKEFAKRLDRGLWSIRFRRVRP